MSGKLPALTGAQVIQALQRGGFAVVRVRSSQHFFTPQRRAHDRDPGSRKILRDAGLDREQFRSLLS